MTELGNVLFKIAKASLASTFVPDTLETDIDFSEASAQLCLSEAWSADLDTGMFKLGETAAAMHGLAEQECGLLGLIRCYDKGDRIRITELFEQASSASSSFCFSSTVVQPNGQRRPVFCVGESTGMELGLAVTLRGVFLFPRFMLNQTVKPATWQ